MGGQTPSIPESMPRDLPMSGSGRTFRADEAPANVDVLMVAAALARSEVIRAQEAVVGQDDAAGSHAVVVGMVGDRAAHTACQATLAPETETYSLPITAVIY